MLFTRIVSSDGTECMNDLAKLNEVELLMARPVGRNIDASKGTGLMMHGHKDVAMNELIAQKRQVSIFKMNSIEIE